MEIFPSLISSDLLNLEKTIKLLNKHCDGYHIDVMDDHLVPNLTWGPAFVRAILHAAELPIHLHLMVDNPLKWVNRVELSTKDTFIFHIETIEKFQEGIDLLQAVKKTGCKVGLALNPETKIENVFEYLHDLDHVLIMSVKPGFSGQKFIPEVVKKIEPLVKKRQELGLGFKIGMDGGIGKENIKELNEKGVDQFGIASSIFSKKDYIMALKNLS